MRTVSGPERTLIGSASLSHHVRVKIANDDGTLIDLTSAGGVDWVDGVQVQEGVDLPVAAANVRLKGNAGATLSLNWLRSDSTLNRDDGAQYAPLVYGGRRIEIDVGVGAADAAAPSSSWHPIFHGYTDEPTSTDGGEAIAVSARDLFARLLDRYIKEERQYSNAAGVAVETVMQQIIDDNVTPAEAVTLALPDGSPGWMIREFKQAKTSVLEALRTLAAQIGWVVRGRFIADVYTLCFFDPDRTKVIDDFTLPPDEYLSLDELRVDDREVRNFVRVFYLDRTTGGVWRSALSSDPTSIADFGERYMEIAEEASSNIDTPTEAQAMADACVSDLADPYATHRVTSFDLWFAEVGDLIGFPANSVHYDDDQSFAVAELTRSYEEGQGKVTFLTRGKPVGAYAEWRRRRGSGARQPDYPAPSFLGIIGEESEGGGVSGDGKVWLDILFDKRTEYIDIYARESESSDVPVPDIVEIQKVMRLVRPTRLTFVQYAQSFAGFTKLFRTRIPMATRPQWYRRVRAFGVSKSGLKGPEYISDAVQAVDTVQVADGVVTSIVVTDGATSTTVTVLVGAIDPTVESFLCLMRNGLVVRDVWLGTTGNRGITFTDYPDAQPGVYSAFIWTKGVTGMRVRGAALGASSPVFAAASPEVLVSGGNVGLRFDYTWGSVPGAFDTMFLERSLDGAIWADIDDNHDSSGGFFVADDNLTGAAWWRLRAEDAGGNVLARSLAKHFPGIDPPGGSDAGNAPIFSVGVGIIGVDYRLVIDWTCANSSAYQVEIQASDDDGGSDPWATVYTSAAVAEGQWRGGNFTIETYYRMRALDVNDNVLATSASQHYTMP